MLLIQYFLALLAWCCLGFCAWKMSQISETMKTKTYPLDFVRRIYTKLDNTDDCEQFLSCDSKIQFHEKNKGGKEVKLCESFAEKPFLFFFSKTTENPFHLLTNSMCHWQPHLSGCLRGFFFCFYYYFISFGICLLDTASIYFNELCTFFCQSHGFCIYIF